jgi:hypothetical protein
VVAAVRPWRELPDAFAAGAERSYGKVVLTVD